MDKWFSMQACANLPHALEVVRELMKHPKFSLKNPNKARAVVSAFVSLNPVQFHAKNGVSEVHALSMRSELQHE